MDDENTVLDTENTAENELNENLQLAENDIVDPEQKESVENEYQEKRRWLEKTKIVRQTWSILEIYQKIKEGKLILNPDYQRREIWGDDKKTAFIESIFMEIMIPPIYVVEIPGDNLLDENKYEVVDGKQRLTAIKHFLEGKLVLKDKGLEYYNDLFKNKNFNEIKDIDPEKISTVLSSILDIYVITSNSPEFTKYDIFARLNRGAEKLKVNEIRRAIYRSSVTEFIKRYIDIHLSDENRELKAQYKSIFTDNAIKRFDDYGRFYRTISFYIRSDKSTCKVNDYNSRPREMINTVLQDLQKKKLTIDETLLQSLLDKTIELKIKLMGYDNADYIIDACVPFFDADTYDLLISKLDQIKTDDVIVESLQKSVSTTANVNARFKRVCEIMGE